MEIRWTHYPTLSQPWRNASVTQLWGVFCDSLRHVTLLDKLRAPLIGPYVLPQGGQRSDIHVSSLTLAIFDVDHNITPASLALCQGRLGDVVHAWYTSHSHTPASPRYRLVVPLARPLAAHLWPHTRARLIQDYAIPADPLTSSSKSHSYFLPSCPPGMESEARSWAAGNKYLDLGAAASWSPPVIQPALVDYDEEDEGEAASPEQMTEYQALIAKRVAKLRRASDPRAEWLQACLDGGPLAQHGQRDRATLSVCALLTYTLPLSVSKASLWALIAPSIEAMRDEGSERLGTDEAAKVKIKYAVRRRLEAEARHTALLNAFDGWQDKTCSHS